MPECHGRCQYRNGNLCSRCKQWILSTSFDGTSREVGQIQAQQEDHDAQENIAEEDDERGDKTCQLVERQEVQRFNCSEEHDENNDQVSHESRCTTALGIPLETDLLQKSIKPGRTQQVRDQTRNQLADIAGVGKTVIYDIERGKETIRFATLQKVLTALNIKINYESPLMEMLNAKS